MLRNKAVYFPNQVWSIDITYIKMQHSHMYLTAIIDWFSRKIMGWELSDTLETALVLNAVQTAVERFCIPTTINSDRANQFTNTEYKTLLHSLNIRQYVSEYNILRPHEAMDCGTPENVYLSCFAAAGSVHTALLWLRPRQSQI